MRQINESNINNCPPRNDSCEVDAVTLTPFKDEKADPCILHHSKPIIKVPVVLAETTIQIVVEANIDLNPEAGEIKRVFKDVFLTQCKLVPVKFDHDEACHGVRKVTRAKLFIEGFIRKDIEYATAACNGVIRDRIAKVHFAGFADLKEHDFFTYPQLGESSESRSRFLDPKHGDSPRLDKFFFENSVIYNEQPFCELVSAKFFELDFSPHQVDEGETFGRLREKIVVDLTVKVLQKLQVKVESLGGHHC